MSARHQLEQLLQNPHVWRASAAGPRGRFLPTGFAELDAALSGGWPAGQLIELLADLPGIGELQLLLPALSGLLGSQAPTQVERGTHPARRSGRSGMVPGKWGLLIAPPYIPYAPAFAGHGLNLSRLLIVRCRRQADVLWTAEQALHSNTCSAVLLWAAGVEERSLRRLQLAAEADGACLLVLFRPLRFRRQHSPATVRIRLRPGGADSLHVRVFKNRGGRPQTVVISLRDESRFPGRG